MFKTRLRLPASRPTRAQLLWSQDGRCLLCQFPLRVRMHLHHLLAVDEGGPDHILNLVGLCPNHHALVETVRRHIAPRETHTRPKWLEHAQQAFDLAQAMGEDERRLFFRISEPHPLRQEIRHGCDWRYREPLAYDVARYAADLLLELNRARPRILVSLLHALGRLEMPQDDAGFEALMARSPQLVRRSDFAQVVGQHLGLVDLPFEPSWLAE